MDLTFDFCHREQRFISSFRGVCKGTDSLVGSGCVYVCVCVCVCVSCTGLNSGCLGLELDFCPL